MSRRSKPDSCPPIDSNAARRLRKLYEQLAEAYGAQQWWPAQTSFEVVIGAYLTQNTAWTAVEKSMANLANRDLLRVEAIRDLPEGELRELIRPSGFILRKAAAIKTFVAALDRDYGGSLQLLAAEQPTRTRDWLLALPGVGPETADAILLYALEHFAVVVDEYLRRVVARHGLAPPNATYLQIQALGEAILAGYPDGQRARHANEFHALIVEVGKQHCRKVPRCDGCPLYWDLQPGSATLPV